MLRNVNLLLLGERYHDQSGSLRGLAVRLRLLDGDRHLWGAHPFLTLGGARRKNDLRLIIIHRKGDVGHFLLQTAGSEAF